MNAIEMIDVRKAFGQTVALEKVSTRIQSGSVHAFLGENGAGKSTTVKMLSGLLQPDKGQLMVFNKEVELASPQIAHELGIQTAFQEMTQIPDLTVAQNLLIPYEPKNRLGLLARKQAVQQAERILSSLNLPEINPNSIVGDLDLALRQKIEIARAVSRNPKILLLDEPTSALSGKDMEWLGGIIHRLKDQGTTIIFISHRMLEVRDYCDRISVLRNGKTVHEGRVEDVTDDEIVKLIIGRSLSATFPDVRDTALSGLPPAIKAKNISVGKELTNVSFELKKGEVLGVAGLQGMGQLEAFKACFGASLVTSGSIEINGKETVLTSPSDAIKAGIDIGFIPEDRKTEGLFMPLSGRHNISLPVIEKYSKFGIVNEDQESTDVAQSLVTMQVEERGLVQPPTAFSGGNQQKMIMSRWLVSKSKIWLMYDPTRGVDIGTKAEIYKLIRNFVAEGGAVLLYSTEIEEVVKLSDRVMVFYGGELAETMARDHISEEAIMETALGQNQLH
ncbi:sugar ABC transporter ATP-binding protein [Vibrio viridaestus]|uniref:Sugar ABC transporter ATP-binding protein n=1 Tax=Vibrio viridaestus TaxID=2487322 RepID=A0A3N9TK19_9VIBR|nr:sugar ABC transporter ATP-binding protein [Vibrio viridaestus]RQW64521.1 sugar ABC transporter ATP-binding protein [Vibrio viridaestus]